MYLSTPGLKLIKERKRGPEFDAVGGDGKGESESNHCDLKFNHCGRSSLRSLRIRHRANGSNTKPMAFEKKITFRGTSLIKKRPPLGHCSRPVLRGLVWYEGGGAFQGAPAHLGKDGKNSLHRRTLHPKP